MGRQLDRTPWGRAPGNRTGTAGTTGTTGTAGVPVLPGRVVVAAVPGASGMPGGDGECTCGRVCVCRVPDGVVRAAASLVAEWHPTAVLDGSPAAERAEDATACRCGQTFCGYRVFARTMRRAGAYVRA